VEPDRVLAIRPALTQYLREYDDCMGKRSNTARLATRVDGQWGADDGKRHEPTADRAGERMRRIPRWTRTLDSIAWVGSGFVPGDAPM
jgi:hypothetical protein